MCAYTIWQGLSMSTYSCCLGVLVSLENCGFRGVSVEWGIFCFFALSVQHFDEYRYRSLHLFCVSPVLWNKPNWIQETQNLAAHLWFLDLGKLDRKWGLPVTLEWPLQGQFLRCETSPSGLHKNSIPARQNYKEMVLHYQFSDWSGSHSSFSSKRWHVI